MSTLNYVLCEVAMSHSVKHRSEPSDAERLAMDRLIERLASQFPEIPAEDLVATVNGQYDDFAQSPIRDFVPILVERAARTALSDPHRHRA